MKLPLRISLNLVLCFLHSGFLGVGPAGVLVLQRRPDCSEEQHGPDVVSAGGGAARWELRGRLRRGLHGPHTGAGDHREYSRAPGAVAPLPGIGPRQPGGFAEALWNAHRSIPAASAAAHRRPPPPAEAAGSLCWPRTWLSPRSGEQLGASPQPGASKEKKKLLFNEIIISFYLSFYL